MVPTRTVLISKEATSARVHEDLLEIPLLVASKYLACAQMVQYVIGTEFVNMLAVTDISEIITLIK